MKVLQQRIFKTLIAMCLAASAIAQQNEFKAEGFSRQINMPENKGTVNINQYLVKSDDYQALTKKLDQIEKGLAEKREDCAAFEAVGNTDRLAKCRQGLAQMQQERDSVAQIITQFKEDVLRLAQTFEHISLNSERLRIAKSLFDAGKFREVQAVMNTQEMMAEGNALLLKKGRLQSGLQETDSLLQIKAEEFIVKAQAKAVDYDEPKRIDSTALCYRESLRFYDKAQTLLDLALFFSDNHQYDSAFVYLSKVIAHPKAEDWQVAHALFWIGNIYTVTGNLPAALDAFTKMFERNQNLHKSDPKTTFYKQNLALSYGKLGETHTALGNLPMALTFFEKETEFFKALHETYPQDVSFKKSLAISYEKLGETHTTLGNLTKALTFFEEETKFIKELHDAYPQDVSLKNDLAISYAKLGETHTAFGNLPQALTFFEQYNTLEKALHEAYPQNVEFKNGLAISYEKLGSMHTALGNLTKALTFFEQYNSLVKELHEVYLKNVDFENGLAISYQKLGSAHTALGNLSQALTFFEKDMELSKALYEAYPQNVDFKNGLAISYEKLGEMHIALGNLPQALTFFEQYNTLEKELHEAYPQNVGFKNGLAVSYQFLGEMHKALDNLPQALTFFEQYNSLEKALHEAYSQNVDFKNLLAISYAKLGETHTTLGNLPMALTFFEERSRLGKELYESYPQNVDFKNGLAISYEKLGSTHTALGNLPQALTFFEQYNNLEKALHEAYPQNIDFKNGLATSYYRLGAFSRDQFEDMTKAKAYFQLVEKLVEEMVKDAPEYALYKRQLVQIQREIAELGHASNPVYQLNQRIQNELDTLTQYQLYTELCDTLRGRAAQDPTQKPALVDALNNRAWTGFFLKKFAAVEADVREGLALETENKYLPSNLAPALLLQGKQKKALREYNKWKDKPFGEQNYPTYREVFLDDLNTFEKAGIVPLEIMPGVEAVRKLLRK